MSMKTEIEVKFLNIDIEDIRAKLQAAGAVCEQPMRLIDDKFSIQWIITQMHISGSAPKATKRL